MLLSREEHYTCFCRRQEDVPICVSVKPGFWFQRKNSMLQLNNLVLALALFVAAWYWQRVSFRTPKFLKIQERTARRLLRTAGWVLIVWVISTSLAGIPAGRIQIAKQGKKYARLESEPARFWSEVVLRILVVGSLGIAYVVLANRQPAKSSTGSEKHLA